ncbi:hypothetical protein AAON49_02300 [Pseudotenacibaculum sp. MALMAid0570]|uniref:hypothetical protein n=1 Tax=Pseudotenacibaculum sp. MALMAid0570 TaxID=3143938 RepID=UPI0032DFDABA
MKYTAILVYLNRFIMGATLLLYLTIFLGLYAQIVLGGFQLLSGLILLFFWPRLNTLAKRNLKWYWITVILYGALCLLCMHFHIECGVFVYIILPMSIAGYFSYVLESFKKNEL